MTTEHHSSPTPVPAPHQVTPPSHALPASYTDGFGIASIICALVFFNLLGFIFGLIGASKAKKAGVSAALSRIGWILNLIGMVIGLIVGIGLTVYLIAHPESLKSATTPTDSMNVNEAPVRNERSVSSNGITLSVPNDYIDISDEYPEANLAQSDPDGSPSIVVYFEDTLDVSASTTVEAYADQSFRAFQQDSRFTDAVRIPLHATIDNPSGLTKVDYKITATYQLKNYVYYERYIKTTRGYYVISMWASPSEATRNQDTIVRTIASFRES